MAKESCSQRSPASATQPERCRRLHCTGWWKLAGPAPRCPAATVAPHSAQPERSAYRSTASTIGLLLPASSPELKFGGFHLVDRPRRQAQRIRAFEEKLVRAD